MISLWNWFKPFSKKIYRPLQGGTSFVDHLCYLCLVFVMLLRLFITALWSPKGKGLTSWLLFVMFIIVLFLSHLVSWDRCGALLFWFLILAVFLALKQNVKKWHMHQASVKSDWRLPVLKKNKFFLSSDYLWVLSPLYHHNVLIWFDCFSVMIHCIS